MAVTIIMFDIDCFKNYNDTYGHQKGDDCIKAIADKIKSLDLMKRPGDLVARYGGEEFIILLINASIEYSDYIAHKILTGISDLKIPHKTTSVANQQYVTVSIGYARSENIEENGQKDLINKADGVLYEAKHKGRNRVCSYLHNVNDDKGKLTVQL